MFKKRKQKNRQVIAQLQLKQTNLLLYRPFQDMDFPCGSSGKESAYNVGDLGLIPGLGRFPGEVKGYALR